MTLALDTKPGVSDGVALIGGGVAGLVAWEIFVGIIVPDFLGGPRFGPTGLVGAVLNAVIGFNPGATVNTALHYLTGAVFYPVALAVLVIAAGKVLGRHFPAIVWGILWGFATWFIAMGVFATIAGFGFMLGFGAITWWSLVGHLVYAIMSVTIFAALRRFLSRG